MLYYGITYIKINVMDYIQRRYLLIFNCLPFSVTTILIQGQKFLTKVFWPRVWLFVIALSGKKYAVYRFCLQTLSATRILMCWKHISRFVNGIRFSFGYRSSPGDNWKIFQSYFRICFLRCGWFLH